MAKISVILPCYNVEQYIDRVMTSLVEQTIGIDNLEIICVDDASTDATWQKLQVWEQEFPKSITIVHCEVNGRQGTARNIGLSYAVAPYIFFLDSDDWLELDCFEKMLEPLQYGEFDVITCAYQRDFSNELTFFEQRGTEKESRSMTVDTVEKRKIFFNLYSCGHPVWGKLIKKSLLDENKIIFPEQIVYEDGYFESLLSFYVKRIYLLEETLYHYYVNKESTVLQRNASHHVDWITVQLVKWRTWEERGFLEDYREELEYEFLWSCFLGFWKLLALRYEEPPYSMFMLAKEVTSAYIPDYRDNKYTEEGFTEFQKLLLQTLLLPIDKAQFQEIIEMIRMHGL